MILAYIRRVAHQLCWVLVLATQTLTISTRIVLFFFLSPKTLRLGAIEMATAVA
jgi:hypothetical protein